MTAYKDPYQNCIACNKRGVDLHHIKSRGSGGSDEAWNLMPLCRVCHSMVHQYGLSRLATNCNVERWLTNNGWAYNEFLGKWLHEG